MADQPHTQIAIIGGGISGLWLLNVLARRGFGVLLLEQGGLGQAQTFASQGMIHGGIKYALGGFTTAASESIANMPDTWRQCLGAQDLCHCPPSIFFHRPITCFLTVVWAPR